MMSMPLVTCTKNSKNQGKRSVASLARHGMSYLPSYILHTKAPFLFFPSHNASYLTHIPRKKKRAHINTHTHTAIQFSSQHRTSEMPSDAVQDEEVKRQCVIHDPAIPDAAAPAHFPQSCLLSHPSTFLPLSTTNKQAQNTITMIGSRVILTTPLHTHRYDSSAQEAKPDNAAYGVGGTASVLPPFPFFSSPLYKYTSHRVIAGR